MSYQKLSRDQIAKRVAQDIPDGAYVNLGIGLPTKIASYLPADKDVFLHSENGLLAFGPPPAAGEEDPELINAGKEFVTMHRPDLGGKNRNELYRIADVMGYLTTVTTGEGKNARVINFKPSPTHHAKNSGALGGETGEVWVPDLKAHPTFLADLITQAKDHINTL
ncbi:CoA-transferase, partial [Acinetobacter baumannii]|uniref:CoA-transferase n=1 Tax=Acinetobacter baumannii TaxID=470 RepID=UPI003ED88767